MAEAPRHAAELLRGAGDFRKRTVGVSGRSGCSTSAGASRWGRERSPASPTSGRESARSDRPLRGARGRRTRELATRLLRWAELVRRRANAALLAIIGLRYLWLYASLAGAVAWSYALVAYVGHVSALACVPLLLVLVPVIALLPRPRLVLPLGVVIGQRLRAP